MWIASYAAWYWYDNGTIEIYNGNVDDGEGKKSGGEENLFFFLQQLCIALSFQIFLHCIISTPDFECFA